MVGSKRFLLTAGKTPMVVFVAKVKPFGSCKTALSASQASAASFPSGASHIRIGSISLSGLLPDVLVVLKAEARTFKMLLILFRAFFDSLILCARVCQCFLFMRTVMIVAILKTLLTLPIEQVVSIFSFIESVGRKYLMADIALSSVCDVISASLVHVGGLPNRLSATPCGVFAHSHGAISCLHCSTG